MANEPKPAETAPVAPEANTQAVAPAPAAAPAASTTVVEKKSSSALPKVLIILLVLIIACLLCSGVAWFLFTNVLNQAIPTLQNAATNAMLNNLESSNNGQTNTVTNNTNDTGSDSDSDDSGLSGSINFGAEIPSTFPSDVPIYTGATATWSTADGAETSVTFTASAKASEIINFYKAQMPNNGYTLDGEFNFLAQVLNFKKGSTEVVVSVIGDESSSESILTIVATENL
ncbi:hypothetical protein IH575_01845 [Candidatus Dojkabacteria bacterium]|nr:hypothetical protein [Candidatus Dojkabacteria bacterium]